MYVPKSWGNYRRHFICTHGWKKRSRGTGKRPQQYLGSVDCRFKFSVTVRYFPEEDVWRLVVHKEYLYHNHAVSPEAFKTLAENRGVTDADTQKREENMIENKRDRKDIYNMLIDMGENVIMKDVDNMISRYQMDVKREDDDVACLGKLSEFSASSDSNCVSIDETAALETGTISLTSEFMNECVERFSEILLVDCSHKTKRYNYQVLTTMAIDDYGQGQIVQHSLLERNADWHMSRALDHFNHANPGVAERVEVLMVDKDLNEIKVLKSYFPRVRVLICLFHVLKYLKLVSRKPEFGTISSDDHDTIDVVIYNVVYADTKETYDENRALLREICAALNFEAFLAYNWHSCQDMWVMYPRLRLPHLRVHTDNHLESFFGHLKKTVKPTMGMNETVGVLIKDDRARAREYAHRKTKIGQFYNQNYDDDMNQTLRFTNLVVASRVEGEYKLVVSKCDVFKFEEDETGLVAVRGHTKILGLDPRTWKCSCSFSLNIKLPCQHAIAYRKKMQKEFSIPMAAVHERWLGAVPRGGAPPTSRLKFTPFLPTATKRK